MVKTTMLLTTLATFLLTSSANSNLLFQAKPANEELRQELRRRMRADQDARKAAVPLLEKKGPRPKGPRNGCKRSTAKTPPA